MNEVKKRE